MSTALDSALTTVVTTLRDCVRTALAGTAAGAPARVCEVAGQLAWDECDCGLMSVTVDRLFFSSAFPQEAPLTDVAAGCAPTFVAANLTVTVLRCAPGPTRTGAAPTCAQLDAAARTWFIDLDAVRGAVECCVIGLRDGATIEEYVLRDQVPLGPEGGCVGVEYRLTVGLANCVCPVGVG